MTVGDIVSIIGGICTLVSIVVAVLGFKRTLKKDREEREKQEREKSNKDVEFYTTTALTLGSVKEQLSDIKTDLKARATKDDDMEREIKGLESRIAKIEGILKIK